MQQHVALEAVEQVLAVGLDVLEHPAGEHLRAGGEPALGVAGTRSGRITWEDAVASRPDVVVCAPCGFDLDDSTTLVPTPSASARTTCP